MNFKTLTLQKRRNILSLVLIAVAFLAITPVVLSRPSATDVGGPITSNTTWTLVNSPYIVVESVEVWDGVTLTIEAGVEVRFESEKRLQIDGEFIAQGTAEQPIIFTSNHPNPQAGDWDGIEFTDSSIDALFDGTGLYQSGSILQHCVVEYAGNNNLDAIYAPASSPFIDHCVVQNNALRGISIAGSSENFAVVSHNTVFNNKSYAQGGGIYAEFSNIQYNTVISNGRLTGPAVGGGIYATNSTLSNNVVISNTAQNGGGGMYVWASTVSSNTIAGNNTVGGGSGGGGIYAGGNSIISNNTISKNVAGTPQWNWNGNGGGMSVRGSIAVSNFISHNTAVGCGGGIYSSSFYEDGSTTRDNIVTHNSSGEGGGICGTGDIINNVIATNSSGRKGGVYVTSTIYDAPIVISNTIINNTVSGGNASGAYIQGAVIFNGNTVIGNSGPITYTVGGVAIERSEIHYNNLYGNSPYDVVIISSSDISGTLNYWGTTDSLDILDRTHDWRDDANLGKLLFIPFYEGFGSFAPLPPPLNITSEFGDNTVTLTWDALPEGLNTTRTVTFTNISGYKIYYGANEDDPYNGTGLSEGDSPVDVGNATTFSLTGLVSGESYYFAITTYDNLGRESWYSKVVARLGNIYVYLPLVIKN